MLREDSMMKKKMWLHYTIIGLLINLSFTSSIRQLLCILLELIGIKQYYLEGYTLKWYKSLFS